MVRQGSMRKKAAYPRLKYCSIGLDKDGVSSTDGVPIDKVDLATIERLLSSPLPSFSFEDERSALDRVAMQRADMMVAKSDGEFRTAERQRAVQEQEETKRRGEELLARKVEEQKQCADKARANKLEVMNATQKDVMASFEAVTGAQRSGDLFELMELTSWDLNRVIAIYFDNGEKVDVCLDKTRGAANAKQPGAVSSGRASITVVYPDNTEAKETFGKLDTLWMVYQQVQASGKISPVGASIRLTAVNPRTDAMDVYTDAKFDTSIVAAGLFPDGQIRVAYG